MSGRTSIDNMVNEIMRGLKDYADVTTETVKQSVNETGKLVKKQIQQDAPKRTGKYKNSWTIRKTKEKSNSLEVTVYSKNRYQIAHLLEHGHAKRTGGRVEAIPHIANAEKMGARDLRERIERGLR